jgi:uncharacterized protein YbjT (DUF2867 family)
MRLLRREGTALADLVDPGKRRTTVNVFLTGATGFVGRHLAAAVAARGHRLTCAVRDAGTESARSLPGRPVAVDYLRLTSAADRRPLLRGSDVVVNAVGILRERGSATFEALHVRAPAALFEACAAEGVRRVVQLSALGADAGAATAYHVSKREADEHLLALPVEGIVVQPSLIYGPGGTSAALFTTLASLPAIPLPGGGRQSIQPIHIDDAVEAIVRIIEGQGPARRRVALVGPAPTTLHDFLLSLRHALQLPEGRVLPVPMALARGAAAAGAWLPRTLLDRDSLSMLERGNVAPVDDTRALLGRPPRAPSAFIEPRDAASLRLKARLAWLLPMLRLSVAAVWIVTGIVSLGLYPVSDSYALLARVGITGALAAPAALYGAALLDLALGIATLSMRRRRALWLGQMALIVGYTVLISVFLPEFWLHPYGPLLKNLPMLAAIAMLFVLEEH